MLNNHISHNTTHQYALNQSSNIQNIKNHVFNHRPALRQAAAYHHFLSWPVKQFLMVKQYFLMALTASLISFLIILSTSAHAETTNNAKLLIAKHTALGTQLANNPFKRPIVMTSSESSSDLKGEIYGVIDHPFNTVNEELNKPENWCDVLILHVNIKYCRASVSNKTNVLTVYLGKKDPQLLTDAYHVDFKYKNTASNADYFSIELNAENGPLGTHDYHIAIEATPIKNGQTFLHFTYAYSFGLAGRLGMKGYLATAGKDKIGFSLEGNNNANSNLPEYVKGTRGVVERNTMRYYLAIDSYLSAINIKPENQLNTRLQHWFEATEQYAPQLHEVEKTDYLEMKHAEYMRQQTAN